MHARHFQICFGQIFTPDYKHASMQGHKNKRMVNILALKMKLEKPAISKRTDATCLHWVDNHHKPGFAKETKLDTKETLIFISVHFKEILKEEDLSN